MGMGVSTVGNVQLVERVLDVLCAALGSDDDAPRTVGDIALHPHQREAIGLLRVALRRYGGALLADPVGTGKTFCALGVAGTYQRVLVAAPACLRDMWTGSLQRARQPAVFVSLESLSRGAEPEGPFDLVVLDEAHHVRNPATGRFIRVARLTAGADVLLLSATPLHNRPADLQALSSLFLGTSSATVPTELLADVIVRRSVSPSTLALPAVRPTQWIPVADDDQLLHELLGLPPPVPPADGGVANTLGVLVLVRQWCSSDAALLAALDRRLTRGAVMAHRLSQGHVPSRSELLHWVADTHAIQLALELDASAARADTLSAQLDQHLTAVRGLRERLRASPARDDQRAVALRGVLAQHDDRRAVLFSHSLDTARMWFKRLMPHRRVACLDGQGGRVASGRLSRREILHALDPHVAEASAAMRIDTLVATDVLSEGVDLHAAALVVHLDLPWTVARIEQRVGRLRRIGSPHREVLQYAFKPPASANSALQLLQRLAAKAGFADALVGIDAAGVMWLGTRQAPGGLSPAEARDALRNTLRGPEWPHRPIVPVKGEPMVAAVAASVPEPRVLAAVALDDGMRLVGGDGTNIVTDPSALLHLARAVTRKEIDVPATFATLAERTLTGWMERERARRELLVHGGVETAAHRRVLRALHATMHSARRPERPVLAPLVNELRSLVLRSVGAGFELLLAEWSASHPDPDQGALRELACLLRARARPPQEDANSRLVAILVLMPETS